MVAYAFNAQAYQPQYGAGGGLPAGPNGEPQKYKVIISDSTQESTANGQGGFLKLALKCIEGPFKDQVTYDRLNLHNQNPKTVEIANKQLSAYCHVTGQFMLQDTQQLHNIPIIIEVGLQKPPNPEGYTEIKRLFDINGNEAGKAGSGPQVHAPAPQPPQGQPPAGGVAQQALPAAPVAQPAWGGAPPAPAPQPAPQPLQGQPGQWGGQPPGAGPAPAQPPAQPPAWGGAPTQPAAAPAAAPAPAWGGQAPAWGGAPQG